MKPTLLLLAAGMGSRYGGLKQLDGLGPNGETIMDYSIYDAIKAGFGKIVFVIRKDFEQDFKEKILSKYEGHIPAQLVFQALDSLPEGFSVPEGRVRTRRIFVLAGLMITLVVAGLTVFAAYIGYTPVGAAEVEGVQPRYMLPVLPLVFIALTCIPAKYQGRNFAAGSAFALLLVNAAVAAYTVLNFRAFP